MSNADLIQARVLAQQAEARGVRGPYVTVDKDGWVHVNLTIPIDLHDKLMRVLVKEAGNPNRSEWIREAIRQRLEKREQE